MSRSSAGSPSGAGTDPAEREALRAADVGPVRVDPAAPALVEKGAAAREVGGSLGKQLGVAPANALGFDLEHRQAVHAAVAAASSTVKPDGVDRPQPVRRPIDLRVQADHGVEPRMREGMDFGFRRHGTTPTCAPRRSAGGIARRGRHRAGAWHVRARTTGPRRTLPGCRGRAHIVQSAKSPQNRSSVSGVTRGSAAASSRSVGMR